MGVDIEYLKQQSILIRDEYRRGANTANRVGSLFLALCELLSNIPVDIPGLSDKFLHKDRPDFTNFLIQFFAGLEAGLYAEGGIGGSKLHSDGLAELGRLQVNGHSEFRGNMSSKDFISGFMTGQGWAMQLKKYINAAGVEETKAVGELDDLIVRGTLRVFEFVVSQMLGENDNRVFTAMLEVDHYDPATGKVWLNTHNGKLHNPFRVDDCIVVQQYNGMSSENNGYYITKQYELVITDVGIGDMSLGEDRLDWVTFRDFTTPMEGGDISLISKGDAFVRWDNLSDPTRKGIIHMMTVGESTPYMDIAYGLKTDPDNALKSRFGNLQGVYNHLFGWLNDFGAYIANLYAVGEFRIAHTGEDVADKIEMVKGAFRTNFSQSYFDMKDASNHLKNGTFLGKLDGWILGESSTEFITMDGLMLYANRNVVTANGKYAGRAVYNDKNMLRILNSDVRQKNVDIKRFGTHREYIPMVGDESGPDYNYREVNDKAYLSMRLFCNGDGIVEVGFDNEDTEEGSFPFLTVPVEKRSDGYWLSAEGVWNGYGDFVIRSTGDIYIEFVTLTDNPIENLTTTTETWMEQDAGRIALLGQKINAVNGEVTNLGLEINAVREDVRIYIEKTGENMASLSQLRIDVDGVSTMVAGVQGDIAEAKGLAQSAKDEADRAAINASDALGIALATNGAVGEHATIIGQHSTYISMFAGRFNDKGDLITSSGMVIDDEFTKIYSKLDGVEASISTFVTHNEMGVAISNIKLAADNVDINGIVQVEGSNSVAIGGFKVTESGLTNEGFDNDVYIVFRNDIHNTFAAIGGNILPASTGARAVARFENHDTEDFWSLGTNYAMLVSAQGGLKNVAIQINGGSISGLALRTQIIGHDNVVQSTAPTSKALTLDRSVGSVYVSTHFNWKASSSESSYSSKTRDIHLTLPVMDVYDDGHVIKIKRGSNDSGTVYIYPGVSYRMVFNSSTGKYVRTNGKSYIMYDNASYATIADKMALYSEGDAMELVYHRDLQITIDGTTFYGCWIQYKHPRTW